MLGVTATLSVVRGAADSGLDGFWPGVAAGDGMQHRLSPVATDIDEHVLTTLQPGIFAC